MSEQLRRNRRTIVAIYIRVSTLEQAREGFSVEGQRDALLAFCKSNAFEVHDIYIDDGYTGADMNRPDLARLRRDAQAGKFNMVLVWKLSRLSRKTLHQLQLVEEFDNNGIIFRSLTEPFDTSNPFGRAFMQVLGILAELERENIRENSRLGIRRRVKEGYVHGRPVPFGYRRVEKGVLRIYEPEAKAVRFIYERYLKGDSLTAIARQLNEWDGPVPETRQSSLGYDRMSSLLQRVRIIIDNPIYAGYTSLGHELFPGKHEAIVPPDVWHEVQRIRQTERRVPKRARRSVYPLAGIIKCGECGRSMSGRRDPNRSRMRFERPWYFYYMCVATRGARQYSEPCKAWGISAEAVEAAVLDKLKELRLDVRSRAERSLAAEHRLAQQKSSPAAALERELASVRQARKRWMRQFEEAEDDMSGIAWERMRELADKEKAILKQIEEAKERSAPAPDALDYRTVISTLENIEKILEEATPNERRDIYRTFIKEIRVYVGENIGKGLTRRKRLEIDTYPIWV